MEAGKSQLSADPGVRAPSSTPGAPPVLSTIRRSLRIVWDHLGLVCGVSVTFFAVAVAGLSVLSAAFRITGMGLVWQIGATGLWFALAMAPLYGGISLVAHRMVAHRVLPGEPPCYADLWSGFRAIWRRAALLGLVELAVLAVLVGNLVFYMSRSGFGFLLLAAIFLYLLAFWLANIMYHWPLFIAAEEGLIPTTELPGVRGRARVSAALRNALILVVGGPLPTLVVGGFLALTGLILVVSGIGLVFVVPGYVAVVSAQAVWDQLVRMGVIEAPPDPDAPALDPGMRV